VRAARDRSREGSVVLARGQ